MADKHNSEWKINTKNIYYIMKLFRIICFLYKLYD